MQTPIDAITQLIAGADCRANDWFKAAEGIYDHGEELEEADSDECNRIGNSYMDAINTVRGWMAALEREPRAKVSSGLFMHRFTVRGRTSFPVDMLRYDNSIPADQQAVADIEASWNGSRRRGYVITLACHQPAWWEPTAKRWESYGWKVRSHTIGEQA